MKKIINTQVLLIALFFVTIMYSCQTTTSTEPSATSTEQGLTTAEFEALWNKIDKLWEEKDPALISTVYADEFVRTCPSGTSRSEEDLSKELNGIRNAYPDMTLDLASYDLCGNMAIIHWTVDGTFTGSFGDVQGNGKKFTKDAGVTIATVENGKITKDVSYWDSYEALRQAGYIIAPPPAQEGEM